MLHDCAYQATGPRGPRALPNRLGYTHRRDVFLLGFAHITSAWSGVTGLEGRSCAPRLESPAELLVLGLGTPGRTAAAAGCGATARAHVAVSVVRCSTALVPAAAAAAAQGVRIRAPARPAGNSFGTVDF